MTKVLSRRALLQGAAVLAAARQVACSSPPKSSTDGTSAIRRPDGGEPAPAESSEEAEYDAFACADAPTAYVVPGASSAAFDVLSSALEAAGFAVEPIDPERSPALLRGLIVIPSGASESAEYLAYMDRHAGELYEFVDNANVLLQLAQSPEAEPSPPFLPTTHTTTRSVKAVDRIRQYSTSHALVDGMGIDGRKVSWEPLAERSTVFETSDGFEIVLTDRYRKYALLLEGAYGQGRIVLSELRFDAPENDPQRAASGAFFANLFAHVHAVCARSAPPVVLGESAMGSFTVGSSMIAALPDTQVYSLRLPGLYHAQTSFLRLNAERLDIKYVLHLGDIVNNNTRLEWERAAAAMSLLHGVIPYALAPGNHDYGPSGDASTRDTFMNEYFAYEQAAAMPTFGGAYEAGKLDSSYHLVSIQGRDFIVIALEWAPRDEVIEWANAIMEAHPDREGILITHAYLNNNDLRYDHTDTANPQRHNPHDYATPGALNDGEQLWQKLVKRHRFSLTLNGHVLGDGCGYLKSTTDRGTTCHQMLSNYQMREQGGQGYMRLLEFLPDGRTVRVHTYSPLFDDFLAVPGHNFDIVLD